MRLFSRHSRLDIASCPALPGHPLPLIAGSDPRSPLSVAIVKQWGSIDAFKADFEAKGVGLFGSGWVWLQSDASGALSIAQYTNADTPRGARPQAPPHFRRLGARLLPGLPKPSRRPPSGLVGDSELGRDRKTI